MFSEKEILDLYNSKVKLPDSYFKKYERLPNCPSVKYGYQWGNRDFPRNWCMLDFKEWIEKYNILPNNMAFTYEDDPELDFIKPINQTLIKYPEYDLHNISNYFTEEFDFFLFSQTLEHLYDPFEAVKSIYKTIKKEGYVFTSVPTLNIPHMVPFHFNGFTPMGLAILFKNAGFEILEIGQWGNHEYIQKIFGNQTWFGYDKLQKNGTVVNEEKNVCQCWILAKK